MGNGAAVALAAAVTDGPSSAVIAGASKMAADALIKVNRNMTASVRLDWPLACACPALPQMYMNIRVKSACAALGRSEKKVPRPRADGLEWPTAEDLRLCIIQRGRGTLDRRHAREEELT
jgi:hypothetical protein